MGGLQNDAQQDIHEWLASAQWPSTRYLYWREFQARPASDPHLQEARQEMFSCGPIPIILEGQTEQGCWAGERSYYTPKYVSTHWSMGLLTELEADGNDPRLQRGADYMLAATQQELEEILARKAHGLSCFWGNLLRNVLHCGRVSDPRVAGIVEYLRHDGLEAGWRCSINEGLPCAWGAARALWGLAAWPAEQASSEIKETIEAGLAFLLAKDHLARASFPPVDRIHPLWFRLNFPLFYQADIFFVLKLIRELGRLDEVGVAPALEWLAGKRNSQGRWKAASPYRRRTYDVLNDQDELDRWVSFHAAIILR